MNNVGRACREEQDLCNGPEDRCSKICGNALNYLPIYMFYFSEYLNRHIIFVRNSTPKLRCVFLN